MSGVVVLEVPRWLMLLAVVVGTLVGAGVTLLLLAINPRSVLGRRIWS